MHPRTQEILEHLDRHRTGLSAAIELVPAGLATRRPAPDRWSAAEVVEHLGLVESRIGSLFVQRVDTARAAGLGPEHDASPVLHTLDVGRLLDRSVARVASDAAIPRGEMDMAAAWSVLERTRQTLREAILVADGLALGEVSEPHARLGPLNMYQWLIFIGAHEGRHAAQIREIAAALAG